MMNQTDIELRRGNPFATRWVRPGALPFIFPPGMNAEQVVEQFAKAGWRGAIVGPHGSGKSTLLAILISAIQQQDVIVRLVTLHDGQRKLPADVFQADNSRTKIAAADKLPQRLIIVDGYEQLGWWARQQLFMKCRRRNWGLLVTVHEESRAARLPVLFRTAGNLQTLQHLVDKVLPAHGGVISNADVAAAFNAHRGNMRETLFAMYDLFEARR